MGTKYKINCFAFGRKKNGAAMCNALKKLDCVGCAWFKDRNDFAAECNEILNRKNSSANEADSAHIN